MFSPSFVASIYVGDCAVCQQEYSHQTSNWELVLQNKRYIGETLLLTHEKMPGFLASGGEDSNPGSETRPDHSEICVIKFFFLFFFFIIVGFVIH